jgi:polar amino acid transport system permease protein
LRWTGVALIALLMCYAIRSLAGNSQLQYRTIAEYMFYIPVLRGVALTVELSVSCLCTGLLLGLLLAPMRMSGNRILSAAAAIYIWVFRSVPPLVQVLFWYNLGSLYASLSLRLPWLGWTLFDVRTNAVVHPMTAALIALTLSEGAYQAEILRSGLLAPGAGQREAAYALGLTHWQALRLVLLPQSVRVLLPPMANQFIHLVKTTAVVSFIALADLLYSVQQIYDQNFQVIPLLTVATLWYMIIVGAVTIGQELLERRVAR